MLLRKANQCKSLRCAVILTRRHSILDGHFTLSRCASTILGGHSITSVGQWRIWRRQLTRLRGQAALLVVSRPICAATSPPNPARFF